MNRAFLDKAFLRIRRRFKVHIDAVHVQSFRRLHADARDFIRLHLFKIRQKMLHRVFTRHNEPGILRLQDVSIKRQTFSRNERGVDES